MYYIVCGSEKNMKVQIDVKEWWNISYSESFQDSDFRGETYTSWRQRDQVFLTELEALNEVERLKSLGKMQASNITLSHIREFA